MITLLLPAPVETRSLTPDPWHRFCYCREFVAYCGAYVQGPLKLDLDAVDDDCAACLPLTVCPNCCCDWDESCELCDPEDETWAWERQQYEAVTE